MAREFARIKTDIGDNPDWTNLPSPAQALYLTCLAHPTLTSAGVLDWRPNRLATRAADWTPNTINTLGHQLEATGFLIIDHNAEYAFIRSFHRHDPFIRQSDRIGTNIATAITAIDSPYIRNHIAAELWRLHNDHPNYAGFKSAALMDFMTHRNPPVETPVETPVDTPVKPTVETPVKTQPAPQPRSTVKTPTKTPPDNPPDSMPEDRKTRRLEDKKKKDLIKSAPPLRPSDDRFDEFWSLAPRKVGKDKARSKFAAAVRRAGDPEIIIDGMRRFANDPNLPEKRFIPHPATWLEGGRWDDEPLPPRMGAGNGGKSARGASGRESGPVENTLAAWGVSPEAAAAFGEEWGGDDSPWSHPAVVDAEIVELDQVREIGR